MTRVEESTGVGAAVLGSMRVLNGTLKAHILEVYILLSLPGLVMNENIVGWSRFSEALSIEPEASSEDVG